MTGRLRRAAILALGLAVAATQLNAPASAGPQFPSPLLPVPTENDLGWPLDIRIKPVSAPSASDEDLLERADGLINAGRLAEALDLTKRELARNESQHGANDPTVASWLIRLGEIKQAQGDTAAAEQSLKRALEIREKAFGRDGVQLVEPLSHLIVSSMHQQRLDDAARYAERALQIAARNSPPDDLGVADLREIVALIYFLQDRFADSIVVLRQVLATRNRAQGPEHPSTVITLTNVARACIVAQQFEEAEAAARRASAAREKKFGPTHVQTAEAIGLLSSALAGRARYREAEPLLLRTIAILEKDGAASAEYLAHYVARQATMYREMGRYADAEVAAKRSLSMWERLAGPAESITATALGELAFLYWEMGRYTASEPLYLRAIAIFEKNNDDGRLVGTALNNIGTLYNGLGRYAEAESSFERAISILEKRHGPVHPHIAASLGNLALLFTVQGRYAQAEPLFQRALSILEKTLGAEHPSTASILANWAIFLNSQDRRSEAVAVQRRALAIFEKSLGPNHPATAQTMMNIAVDLSEDGNSPEAERLMRRAIGAFEASLGTNHTRLLQAYAALSGVLADLNRLDEAEQIASTAVSLAEQNLGPKHHAFAEALYQLGDIKFRRGKLADAEPLLRRAIAIFRSVLAPADPRIGKATTGLSLIVLELGRPEEAVNLAREALSLRRERKTEAAASRIRGGHQEELKGRRANEQAVRAMFALAQAKPAENAKLLAEAFDAAQAMEIDETGEAVARMAARFAAGTGALAGLLREQQNLQSRIPRLNERLAQALSSADPTVRAQAEGFRQDLAALDARLKEVDATLRRDHKVYAELIDPNATSLAAIQDTLGSDEAIVFHCVVADGVYAFAISKRAATWTKSNLGEDELRGDVAALRRQLDPDQWQGSFAPFDRTTAHALYRELWAPLEPALKGATHVLVVPTGPLTSLPLAVLVTEEPKGGAAGDANPQALRETAWLAKRYALTTLPSISSLRALRLYANKDAGTEPFVGFGDPSLGGGGTGARGIAGFFRGASPDTNALRTLAPLPGTAGELKMLAKALGASESTDVFLRERATESRIKSTDLTRKRVIAFATHALTAGDLGLGEPGLVLTPPSAANDNDDGYLSASEAARLDLRADWIILSACNTAAGDAPGAKGLSGLARAFFLAGARSLLVSHWPVWDDVAGKMTTTTVKNFQANPAQGRAEALRQAMLAIMNDTSSTRFAHPAAWAPFVLVGEPRSH